MCGIVGAIGDVPVVRPLLDGLRRLEHRGYDSAGIATLSNGRIDRRRAEGKLENLEALVRREPIPAPSASLTHAGRPMADRARATPILTRPAMSQLSITVSSRILMICAAN
jgi:glutamine phosphoribosylpyrophosphate amidotransferase